MSAQNDSGDATQQVIASTGNSTMATMELNRCWAVPTFRIRPLCAGRRERSKGKTDPK
jgi:hypothetical protein